MLKILFKCLRKAAFKVSVTQSCGVLHLYAHLYSHALENNGLTNTEQLFIHTRDLKVTIIIISFYASLIVFKKRSLVHLSFVSITNNRNIRYEQAP